MTTTSGYRLSQAQRVDSGLKQNVANTARLGTNSPGSFGEAPRDRRSPHRTRKHLRSRLLAFYQLPELVFSFSAAPILALFIVFLMTAKSAARRHAAYVHFKNLLR